MARVVVDSNERGLIDLSRERAEGFEIKPLPVGDVLCEYPGGNGWVAERKKAPGDLSQSLCDGRWKDQLARLAQSNRKVILIIEGELPAPDNSMYKCCMGAWVRTELQRAHVFRTTSLSETFDVLCTLIHCLETPKCRGVTGGGTEDLPLPKLASKRKRDGEPANVQIRMLMCIPSISERVARKLIEHFGSVDTLRESLRTSSKLPRLQLDDKHKIGPTRWQHLRRHLLGDGADLDETQNILMMLLCRGRSWALTCT